MQLIGKIAFLYAVALGIGLPELAVASSPSCGLLRVDATEWANQRLNEADTIILGRVYSIKEVPQEEPEPEPNDSDGASSMAELLRLIEEGQERSKAGFDHVVSFEVIKAWKDPIHPIVRTKVRLGTLARSDWFQKGDVFLVAGRDLEGTLYSISKLCRDTIPQASAQKFIEALNTEALSD